MNIPKVRTSWIQSASPHGLPALSIGSRLHSSWTFHSPACPAAFMDGLGNLHVAELDLEGGEADGFLASDGRDKLLLVTPDDFLVGCHLHSSVLTVSIPGFSGMPTWG